MSKSSSFYSAGAVTKLAEKYGHRLVNREADSHRGSRRVSQRQPSHAHLLDNESLEPPHHCIIMPDSSFRLMWDLFILLLILYYAVAVPVRVGFDIDPSFLVLEHFFTACFFLDIFFNFNTGFKVKGQLMLQHGQIAKNYLKGWFLIDLVASFPFDALVDETKANTADVGKLGRLAKIFKLVRLFKLLRLFKLSRILSRLRQSTQVNPNVLVLWKTLGVLACELHWAACGYWFLATGSYGLNEPSDSWR